MLLLIINHHYFREKSSGRGIYPINKDHLLKEIKKLKKNNWEFGSEKDILRFTKEKFKNNEENQDSALYKKDENRNNIINNNQIKAEKDLQNNFGDESQDKNEGKYNSQYVFEHSEFDPFFENFLREIESLKQKTLTHSSPKPRKRLRDSCA